MTEPPPRTMNASQAALARELARVARLNAERAQNPILTGALGRLSEWQSRRLRMTYADLAAQPRYADAIEFFQQDLYGAADFSRRDADLARVVPVIVRLLPENLVSAVALAVELNALSGELDRVLLSRLPRADGNFTVAEYCKAYRRTANFPLRKRQIKLIGDVGIALDRYVGKPLVRTALTMMRQPARMAGMGVLQDFLERGFAAFRRMHGAAEFLATIETRETAIHDAIAHGSIDPFPDPMSPATANPRPLAASH
jgi:hypothetical protein